MKLEQIKDMPRERHYVLGHEAFKQMCEYDPHQFFECMVAENASVFISELVKQVELGCPNDNTQLDPQLIDITPSVVGSHPVIIIKMPPVEAFAECIYVGIVAMMDIKNPESTPQPEIHYFTIELGEGENEVVNMFCQWQQDTHYNLAELSNGSSINEFLLLIKQRLGEQ